MEEEWPCLWPRVSLVSDLGNDERCRKQAENEKRKKNKNKKSGPGKSVSD